MNLLKPKFWTNKRISIIALILLPVSIIYIFFLFLKKIITSEKNLNIKVICVGNIYIGGTGKTPMSLKIYEILKKMGRRPVIIKKYYKNHIDEINLIKKKIKHIMTANSRVTAILNAKKNKFDTIILDDGFQDQSIKKDLNILCFNQKQLIGNGLTIPAGPLREPLYSIKKSHMILINGKKNKEFEKKIQEYKEKINFFYTNYIPVNYKKFKNKNLIAFAGIGNPNNFFDLLKQYNINVKEKISFPDHYNFSRNDLKQLVNKAKKKNCELITTEKDYFRIKGLSRSNINYLTVKLKIVNEKDLIKEIKNYL
tara:strand:+ start:139 stop:1071 length:933 start_codon:yes stop_codon:yes gene_type:complete